MEIKPTIRVKTIIKRKDGITVLEDVELVAVNYCGGMKVLDKIIKQEDF